jgi:hypothetical protein
MTPTQPQTQPARRVTPDDEQWEKEAVDAQHKSLATVQATAASWEKSIAAVLGAFALVAFVKGPAALTDIPTGPKSGMAIEALGLGTVIDPGRTVGLLIFVSAALVMFAVVSAAIAAQGVPVWVSVLDGFALATRTRDASISSIKWLRASRAATVLGAAVLFGAMAIAWLAVLDKPAELKTQSAIVSNASATVCGELRAKSGGALEVAPKDGTPVAVGPTSQIVLVEKCPAAAP